MTDRQRGGPPRPVGEVVQDLPGAEVGPKDDAARADPAGGGKSPALHAPHHCKSCGGPIYWGRTEAGRSMPVDAEPVPDGNVLLSDRHGTVVARVLRRGEEPPVGAKLRRAHHSTCPHADDWRAAKKGRDRE